MIRIPIDYFRGDGGPGITIDGYEGTVALRVEAEEGAGADPARDVSLQPCEARALAAALLHFAGELEASRA